MTNPVIPLIIGTVTFSASLYLIIKGIRIKRFKRVLEGIGLLGLTFFCFLWLGIIAAGKAYTKGTEKVAKIKESFQPRTGKEIYIALFGHPVDNCVSIINKSDQVVPRLDCCIWLDIKLCPLELRRIVALDKYKSAIYHSSDTTEYLPGYSPKPVWWTPNKLSETVIVLTTYNSDRPNRNKILIFAKDSAHAYYCDMAD